MQNQSMTQGLLASISALAVVASLAGTPDAASGATAQASPCPQTIQVDGRTATLTAFVCGSVTASLGTPWPISIGVTVGHCTGCECGYVWGTEAGSQFTRRGVADCGFGSPGGFDGDGPSEGFDEDGCQWGRDYIGWEPSGC